MAIAPSGSGLPPLAILPFRIEAPLGKVVIFAPTHYTLGGRGGSSPARPWPSTYGGLLLLHLITEGGSIREYLATHGVRYVAEEREVGLP